MTRHQVETSRSKRAFSVGHCLMQHVCWGRCPNSSLVTEHGFQSAAVSEMHQQLRHFVVQRCCTNFAGFLAAMACANRTANNYRRTWHVVESGVVLRSPHRMIKGVCCLLCPAAKLGLSAGDVAVDKLLTSLCTACNSSWTCSMNTWNITLFASLCKGPA